MASSAISYCFLLLSFFYASSLQIHARENHYFSKVTPYNTNTNTDINNVEKTELSPKETNSGNQNVESTLEKTEPSPKETNSGNQNVEPTLIPETHNGYGLYGREIDQGTQDTYTPEKTSTEGYNGGENSEFMFNNGNPYNGKNNFGYENKQNSLYENNLYNGKNNFGYENKQNSLYENNYKSENSKNSVYGNNEAYNNNNNRYQYPMRRHDELGSSGVKSRNQFNQEGMDENLYKFNNFMENNNNQDNKEEYVP
ncbi:hypothetical protein ACHQM5_017587 [Ranunculus cassubicifolius]